jgi:para-nitrobenzyl esterase
VSPKDVGDLLHLPVEHILEAQEKTLLHYAIAAGGDPRLKPASMAPFQLVVDGEFLPEEPVARKGSMDDTELMIGVNAEEMGFVFGPDDTFWQQDEAGVLVQVEATWGAKGLDAFVSYVRRDPSKTAPEVLCTLLSEEGAVPSINLAERKVAAGRPAYFAWFTWRSPAFGGRLGAAHTVELPFVFNNLKRWAASPILEGADQTEVRGLATALQDAWIAFATTGIPDPNWPPYVLPERAAMEFGRKVGVIPDPAANRTTEGLTFRTYA